MANAAVGIKVPDDIEYRLIGNVFGLVIVCGGLLAGNMVSERSLDYWREDIAVLVLLAIIGFRLSRNSLTFFNYCLAMGPPVSSSSHQDAAVREKIEQEFAAIAQLPDTSEYSKEKLDMSPDKVVEQVVKRIEAQKAEAARLKRTND